MSTEFMAKCRSEHCGREIIMGELNGSPHPYDKPTKCPACGGAGSLLTAQAGLFPGEREQVSVTCKKCKGAGWIRKSHFSSCPDAERFRRKKEGAS